MISQDDFSLSPNHSSFDLLSAVVAFSCAFFFHSSISSLNLACFSASVLRFGSFNISPTLLCNSLVGSKELIIFFIASFSSPRLTSSALLGSFSGTSFGPGKTPTSFSADFRFPSASRSIASCIGRILLSNPTFTCFLKFSLTCPFSSNP